MAGSYTGLEFSTGGFNMRRMNESSVSPEELVEIIQAHPFFHGADDRHVRILAKYATVTSFDGGELVFRQGDTANRFYALLSGRVALEAVEGANRHVIEEIGSGNVLGWSWLFAPYRWNFDARAIEPVRAIFFYATPLRERCEQDHDLGYGLMSRMADVLMRRLQATRRQLVMRGGSVPAAETA
jgi:CRP/FNR family cyclic AMP-dependent transcriptional regulator